MSLRHSITPSLCLSFSVPLCLCGDSAVMISSAVIKLCEEVKRAGGRALLAGGWVRDFARGADSVDYDIEVYGLEAPVLRSLIEAHGKVDAVGEAFTVYKVRLRDRERRKSFVVDVSLPRRESKT